MAKKDRIRMPSGMAGILRHDEEVKEAIKIKPKYVIGFSVGIIVLELLLRFFG